jgi:hypothetical protein
MLEWTGAGEGARLRMLVYHDDAQREYAYGPAGGLPDTKVGTFDDSLMIDAQTGGWTVISMKNDWRRRLRVDAEIAQIVACQLAQNLPVNVVVAERGRVLFEPEVPQPFGDIH